MLTTMDTSIGVASTCGGTDFSQLRTRKAAPKSAPQSASQSASQSAPRSPSRSDPCRSRIELVCRVDTLAKLKAAVDAGADAVEVDAALWKPTRGERCPGSLGLDLAVRYAREHGCGVVLACETRVGTMRWANRRWMVDEAVAEGVEALLVSDVAFMLWSAGHYPQLRLHLGLSQVTEAPVINRLHRQFGITRVVMPRMVSVRQLSRLAESTEVELEVVGAGTRGYVASSGDLLLRKPVEPGKTVALGVMPVRTSSIAVLPAVVNPDITSAGAANDDCYPPRDIKMGNDPRLPELFEAGVRAIKLETCDCTTSNAKAITAAWRRQLDLCEDAFLQQ